MNKLINGFFSEVPRRLSTSLRYMYHIPKLSPRVLKFVNFAPELPRILAFVAFVSRVHTEPKLHPIGAPRGVDEDHASVARRVRSIWIRQ